MLFFQPRLFSVKTCQYSEDYHLARSQLSPGLFDSGVRANLSTDYDEDQVND
jgi:hypothetical protein